MSRKINLGKSAMGIKYILIFAELVVNTMIELTLLDNQFKLPDRTCTISSRASQVPKCFYAFYFLSVVFFKANNTVLTKW